MRHGRFTDYRRHLVFPRLRAGTFIEAVYSTSSIDSAGAFPRLRAGTFIEAE